MVAPVLVADTNAVRLLPLSECVTAAVEHNFDVKIERQNVAIARHQLGRAYGEFDPRVRMQATRGNTLTPAGFDEENRRFLATETEQDQIFGGIDGLLPTGLQYDLTTRLTDSSGEAPDAYGMLQPFDNTRGGAGIELRQPLLKNFWIDEARVTIQVNRKQLRISELALRTQLMTVIGQVEAAFYDLLLARESVKVQLEALALAERLVAANRERIRQGVMAALDEKQAESQASAQRSLLLSAQRAVGLQENVVKSLLSDHFADWQDISIQPVGELGAAAPRVQRNESWERGLSMRPDLLQAREEVARRGVIAKFTRNQLFPQLDAVGSYGHSASDAEFSGAFEQIRHGSSPFHSYGLEMTVPLTRKFERESHQISRREREKAELQLRQLEQDVLLQIDDAVKVVEVNYERVGTTKQAREFAEIALQAEQTKMENGRSTSFIVLQLQRDLTTSRSEEIRALAEYNKALSQLALREGTMLARHKIELQLN
jgi:outer membrane protein TolC